MGKALRYNPRFASPSDRVQKQKRKMNQKSDPKTPTDPTVQATLEDQLYLQADKLLALCAAQTALDNSDEPLALGIRSHYSLLME